MPSRLVILAALLLALALPASASAHARLQSTTPQAGANPPLTRILLGAHDYNTGLDVASFEVVADFAIDGTKPGEDLAKRFRPVTQGVWELKLTKVIVHLPKGKLTVAVKDKQGNVTRIERTFSVGKAAVRD